VLSRRRRTPAAGFAATAPAGPLAAQLAAARDARVTGLTPPAVIARRDAMQLSVINRARDLIVGTLAGATFTRATTWGLPAGAEPRPVPAGWLEQPDPLRTRAAWTAAVVDDLFFHGWAACRVTVRDANGYPAALEHLWWRELTPPAGHPAWDGPDGPRTFPHLAADDVWQVSGADGRILRLSALHVVAFESPVAPVLEALTPLWIAARLEATAARFATAAMPIGWLKQTGGLAVPPADMATMAADFEAALSAQTVAYLNEWLEYRESQADPSRLQLVESRSYADVTLARVANVPAFLVNAAVPGDSMTYKTALTARLDLIDFGLAPYIACLEQTLSGPAVTPNGTTVAVDLSRFLRSDQLAAVAAATPAPAPATEAAHA
jgi:hypothetical protein